MVSEAVEIPGYISNIEIAVDEKFQIPAAKTSSWNVTTSDCLHSTAETAAPQTITYRLYTGCLV